MSHYQGSEIAFNLTVYADENKQTRINLDNVSQITIYVYTDGCKVAKFSKTTKSGYTKLIRNTAYQYAGVISSEETKLMSTGTIMMEIRISYNSSVASDGKWDVIKKSTIGQLLKPTIKYES